jgi:hypothetical protein
VPFSVREYLRVADTCRTPSFRSFIPAVLEIVDGGSRPWVRSHPRRAFAAYWLVLAGHWAPARTPAGGRQRPLEWRSRWRAPGAHSLSPWRVTSLGDQVAVGGTKADVLIRARYGPRGHDGEGCSLHTEGVLNGVLDRQRRAGSLRVAVTFLCEKKARLGRASLDQVEFVTEWSRS